MKLWVTGLNHRTAPVEVRERLALDQASLPVALKELVERPGLHESMILSTCNRVEVALTADDDADPEPLVEDVLARVRSLDPSSIHPYLYTYSGRDAVRHLFRVAASLDSMVVGEPQILGQMKAAYSVAKAEGTVNGYLDNVVTRAFGVAKRVRTETEIGSSAVSVSYAAVELAREIFGSLKSRKVMLVGAGKMCELAARHLRRSGVAQILVTNRTLSRAEQLAEMVDGVIVPYDEFYTRLPEVDIVLTSSGAPTYLLRKEQMRRIIEARRNRPVFVIDIAVPRNVEPAVNEIDNVYLYDIDDLQKVVERNVEGRMSEAEQADRIVAEEVDRLETWMRARHAGPLIASLQTQLDRVRAAELERLRGKLGALTPQQEEALEALTRAIVNKIAHGPISELRSEAGAAEGSVSVEVIRRIFRLDRT
jgi:glutamyl-tRNA reductase